MDHAIFKRIFDPFNIGMLYSAKTDLQNVNVLLRPNWTNAFWTELRAGHMKLRVHFTLPHPAVKPCTSTGTRPRADSACDPPPSPEIPTLHFDPDYYIWWVPEYPEMFISSPMLPKNDFFVLKFQKGIPIPITLRMKIKQTFGKKPWNTHEKQKDAKSTRTKSL